MRTGSCAVQQGLTTEAASIVKQAVTLAKRRGHAQVTPLHVASTMLSITNGLLRTACLQSHSHPLQCKALELCFNVALNRLPATTTTSSSNPMLGGGPHNHHSQCPSISNALVAAFKRAQAHQRRGSIENQQQPLLAVKIEIEQLIISILDDPSVSRVMREAGFNSTQVKSNVEQAVSLEICSSRNTNNNNDPSSKSKENNNNNNNNPIPTLIIGSDTRNVVSDQMIRDEDIESVVDSLKSSSTQRRSVVVVGECVDTLEGVVRGVMDKVEKGGVKFVSLSLADFGNVSRVEVDQKIEELKGLIAKRGPNGYVLYLGDLKWVFDYRDRCSSGRVYNNYCPVDHLVNEIGKLVNSGVVGESGSGRFWVMGIATFQAYMRCKNGHPSLETLWGLHPISIPAGSLRLSLITDSGLQNQPTNKDKADKRTSWLLHEGVGDETQVRSLQSSACNSDSSTSSLPAWLQQYKNENKGINSYNDQNCVPVGELCKKWNSMCGSTQKQPYLCDKTLTLSSVVSPSSTSGFSYEQHQQQQQHSQSSDHNIIWISESTRRTNNPNSTSDSSDLMEIEHVITTSNNFKELNSENMKTLCNALDKKVPWQKDVIPEIVSTVLQCRSGLVKRTEKENNNKVKEDTWLFFQGADVEGKEKIARELARFVFGSHSNNFVSISLSSFASSTRSGDSSEDNIQCCRNKRTRDEPSYCSYIERFCDAVSSNPHRVFLVEDIEQADYCSQLGFKRAIERGRVEDSNGDEVGLCDAIIILSCESFSSRSRACSPNNYNSVKQSQREEKEEHVVNVGLEETSTTSPCGSLDLNIPIDDDECCDVEDRSVEDDIGLLECVDRKVIFKIQEL